MAITFRIAQRSDAREIVEFSNRNIAERSSRYSSRTSPYDEQTIERIEKRLSAQNINYCSIIALDGKDIIGVCTMLGKNIGRLRHRAECGWSVDERYQRKGIGIKMLQMLIKEARKRGVKRLEAEIASENTASIMLAEKAGFVREGEKRDGILLDDGRYISTYIYGLLFD